MAVIGLRAWRRVAARRHAMTALRRVAILGAESTGKSTLAAALALRYNTVWVPEYLREFVATEARVPFEGDQFGIAQVQAEREQAAEAGANRFLFCDTTPFMTAIYSGEYWGRVDAATGGARSGFTTMRSRWWRRRTDRGCRTACSANRKRCASRCTRRWSTSWNGARSPTRC